MTTSFRHSKDKLLAGFLDLLWAQWSALGVAGQGTGVHERLIDPEALLLVTTRLGRHDPRLLDEVLDWLEINGARMNLQRLQRLQEMWPVGDMRVLGAIASILSRQSAMRKWATLSKDPVDTVPEPLFIGAGGKPLPVLHQPDPHFLRHGLLRDTVDVRGMSKPPGTRRASNLLCTLRSLFGVNARAEIMAWLLTHESGHPAAIARDTGYFSKSIQYTLNEMEDSGQIHSRRDGREKVFRIRPDDWRFLITWRQPEGFPVWTQWMPLFSGTLGIIKGLGDPSLEKASIRMQPVLLRKSLEHSLDMIYQTEIASSLATDPRLTGGQFVNSILADAATMADHLSSMAGNSPASRPRR